MPHEVHASIQVMLPDDPAQMAGTLSQIAAAWATLLDKIDPTPCTPTFAVNETRTSRAARKPRTPRLMPASMDTRFLVGSTDEEPQVA